MRGINMLSDLLEEAVAIVEINKHGNNKDFVRDIQVKQKIFRYSLRYYKNSGNSFKAYFICIFISVLIKNQILIHMQNY